MQRGQDEHAIALLIGKPPAEVSIPPAALAERVPIVPTTVPSILLERRPDIAEAERQMKEENALIGVQVDAYFPTFDLSAVFGYAGNPGTALFSSSSEVWTLMASASQSVLTGGQRSAAVAAARAAYDQSVANYRETVLAAFQNVEDELVALRVLGQQIGVQRDAVAKAQQAVQISLNEYQAGTIAYTDGDHRAGDFAERSGNRSSGSGTTPHCERRFGASFGRRLGYFPIAEQAGAAEAASYSGLTWSVRSEK